MPLSSKSVLAECRRIESMLREIEQRALTPHPEVLTTCENELGGVASSLETLQQLILGEPGAAAFVRSDDAIRQTLRQIREMAQSLNIRFQHGSNYCAGLLQVKLGTGYSEQGLPVFVPSHSRNSFEG